MLSNNNFGYKKKELLNILKNYQNINLDNLQKEADYLRKKQVGDKVMYVVNRNINFTNICEQHCSFCAFRRDENENGSVWLDIETILSKCQQAIDLDATEICMQGGLNPQAQIQGSSLKYYLQLIENIKNNFPQLHLHGFSPQ